MYKIYTLPKQAKGVTMSQKIECFLKRHPWFCRITASTFGAILGVLAVYPILA